MARAPSYTSSNHFPTSMQPNLPTQSFIKNSIFSFLIFHQFHVTFQPRLRTPPLPQSMISTNFRLNQHPPNNVSFTTVQSQLLYTPVIPPYHASTTSFETQNASFRLKDPVDISPHAPPRYGQKRREKRQHHGVKATPSPWKFRSPADARHSQPSKVDRR